MMSGWSAQLPSNCVVVVVGGRVVVVVVDVVVVVAGSVVVLAGSVVVVEAVVVVDATVVVVVTSTPLGVHAATAMRTAIAFLGTATSYLLIGASP